jgi:DNA-binding response OmpR family regulator
MKFKRERRPIILVVEGEEETRLGIERLLTADNYSVVSAKDEAEAVLKARSASPDLILMSLGGAAIQLVAVARRIRERSELREQVPIVLFCILTVDEGAEVEVPHNIYLTRPDNFDQLRRLLSRLLR